MPSNDTRHDLRNALSRRRYVQALAAAGLGVIAGCGGDGDESTPTPTEGNGGTPTATPTPTDTPGEGTPDGTDTPTDTDTGTPQPVVNDTISTAFINVPQQSNLNNWAETVRNTGIIWVTEVPYGYNAVNRDWYLGGYTYDTPHFVTDHEQVELVAILRDIELEPPFDTTYTMDERLTFWDGETPIDAVARENHNYLTYVNDGNLFDDTATFNTEVTGEFEVHEWRNKGDVEGQEPDPANEALMRSQALWGEVPFHPEFTQPYVDQFRDASSSSEADNILSSLRSDSITYFDLAENDWGSGSYRVESADDVTSTEMIGRLRDDHPVSEWANIPNLRMQFTSSERFDVLESEGEIDIIGNFLGEDDREAFPDHFRTIDKYPYLGGDQYLFNWNNDHMANLWVRRALVSTMDWIQMMHNGWGPEQSIPVQWQIGMNNNTALANYDEDWLNQLYQYPMRTNDDLASDWMTRAGYTKTGGNWISPDGNQVSMDILWTTAIPGWQPGVQTVADNLREFGFNINIEGVNWAAYQDRLSPDNMNYDLGLHWAEETADIWQFYDQIGAWWSDRLLDGNPEGSGPLTPDSEMDTAGKPIEVQIPTQPGVIDAPEPAGRSPDLAGAGIDSETINLVTECNTLRAPDVTEERFQQAAERLAIYYNYYLPNFQFHQLARGLSGNVRDFTWAPRGNVLNRTWWSYEGDHLITQAGLIQGKYDTDYEPRGE